MCVFRRDVSEKWGSRGHTDQETWSEQPRGSLEKREMWGVWAHWDVGAALGFL